MKKISLALLLTVISGIAFSQIRRIPSRSIQKDSAVNGQPVEKKGLFPNKRDGLAELNLSPAQLQKLKGIKNSFKSKLGEIENDDKLSTAEKENLKRDLRKNQLEQIQATLSKDQIEKFKALREKNKQLPQEKN
jgi:hypothetical protein